MKNTKVIIAFILILSVLANPIIMNAKDYTAKAYSQADLYQEEYYTHQDHDIAFDQDSGLIVEAGGPYQTVPGGRIDFKGYFQLLQSYETKITGYTWNFGDATSFSHVYDPVLNGTLILGNIFLCPADHIYSHAGAYTATLVINYESNLTAKLVAKDHLLFLENQKSDSAQVTVAYDPWDEQLHPNSYFIKKVFDIENGWRETTTLKEGDDIQFKITYTATSRIDNVIITDYLPATVRFINATPLPDSIGSQVHFDQLGGYYIPTTVLTWNIGDMYAGESTQIIINGKIEYLTKSDFGIPADIHKIFYKYENLAKLKGTRHSAGCGNPYTVTYTDTANFVITQEHPKLTIEKLVKKNCNGIYDEEIITVNQNDWVTFWLIIKNSGDVVLQNVNVSDNLPLDLTYNDNAMVEGAPQEPIFINDHNFYWNLGTLNVGQIVNITFQAGVPDCGVFRNIATVTGFYGDQGIISDNDDATVLVNCIPDVVIEKTVRKTECDPWVEHLDLDLNDEVYFKIDVTNTGETILELIISDVLPNNLVYINNSANYTPIVDGSTITWLFVDVSPDEHIEIIFKAKVVGCGFGINWAYVSDREQSVFDENNATVDVFCEPCEPEISIEKKVWNGCEWADTTDAEIGDTVRFKVVIYNPSDCYLIHFSGLVFDQLPDNLRYENGSSTIYQDWPNLEEYNWGNNTVYWRKPPSIMPGENLTFYYNAKVVDCGLGVNNVTAHPEGFDPIDYPGESVSNADGSYDVSAYASVNVICGEPDIDVKKSVKLNCHGDYNYEGINISSDSWVTFRIEVTNTGDFPLDINVSDSLPIGFSYNNNAKVDGVAHEPDNILTPLNGHIIYVWHLNDVKPGQTVTITFEATVNVCGKIINLVDVVGIYGQYPAVSDEDEAFVFVLCPDIDIEKTANLSIVCTGEEVTYTYNVTNIGNAPLRNVVVTDDKIASVSGDGNGWLYPGETWFFTAVSVLCENTTNVGTVTAEDEFGKQVSDEDIVFVEVVDCEEPPQLGIEVIKKVKRNGCEEYNNITYVHQCDEVKFLLESTNTGEGALSACVVEPECDWVSFLLKVRNTGEETLSVFVEDILPAGLTYMGDSYVDGIPVFPVVDGNIIVWDIGDVGFGETVEITFDATVDGQVCGSLINTVYVNGSYQDYPKVTDDDSAEVFVLCPGIDIEKTASQTIIQPGEEVTYTYELNNIGNCRLTNVVVMDDQGLVPIYISGDTNVDDWLDVDETWIFTASTHLYESTTNIGTVTAEDELGKQVSDNNDAYVEVHECVCTPNISIDKKIFNGEIWVDSLSVESYSTNVTFKITIKNTGTCDLTNIVVIDTMKCGLDYPTDFSITPDEINNGQLTWYLEETLLPSQTISITFNATAHMNTSNEVLVTANSTYDQTPVSANDEVTITKEGEVPEEPILAYAPESLSFGQKLQNQTDAKTIEIWNDGTGTLTYELSKDCSWLELSKTSGTSTGGDGIIDIITVKINTTGLDLGVYTCNISITSNGGDGIVIVNVTVVDEEQPLPPTVNISKPASGKLYFRDKELFKLANTLLIGPIEIVADAESIDATITKMEVYIDDIMKFNDTNSSISFFFNEVIFGSHTIKVKAYDSNGLSTQKELDIRVFNFGRVK